MEYLMKLIDLEKKRIETDNRLNPLDNKNQLFNNYQINSFPQKNETMQKYLINIVAFGLGAFAYHLLLQLQKELMEITKEGFYKGVKNA